MRKIISQQSNAHTNTQPYTHTNIHTRRHTHMHTHTDTLRKRLARFVKVHPDTNKEEGGRLGPGCTRPRMTRFGPLEVLMLWMETSKTINWIMLGG